MKMQLIAKVEAILIGMILVAAPAYCEESAAKLDSLDLSKVCLAGQGSIFGNHVRGGKSILNKPIMIAGRKFETGVGVMAHSVMYIKLNKAVGRFAAQVGVDDAAEGNTTVKFRVLGDGKELYNSGLMKKGDAAKPVDVDVNNIDVLVLVVVARGEMRLGQCADWADAKFLSVEEDPKMIRRPVEKAELLTPPVPQEPRINGAKIFGVRPNSPFLFTIPASGKRPMKFSARNLPKGLNVDASTGIISGTIDSKGRYDVTLIAENELGRAQRDFRIVVGDTLALTPPMGWNSWYVYGEGVDDAKMRAAADAMVGTGMIDHGYSYVNIDDAWMVAPDVNDEIAYNGMVPAKMTLFKAFLGNKLIANNKLIAPASPRDPGGRINANSKFPDMKALTGYIHSLGLKAGIYTSPGPLTCGCYAGSYGHELLDAERFAEWGFDFLKYDWCTYANTIESNSVETLQKPYRQMADALKHQKRDIVYNLCQYGMGQTWKWPDDVKGNCWRTDTDLGLITGADSLYCNFITIGFGHNGLEKYAHPGHWNDPDYIMIGFNSQGPFKLSPNEQYTYMSLWSLLDAPLIYSGDMTKLDSFMLNVLCNDEIIAVNQDPLGQQAHRITWDDGGQTWAKDMEDGSKVVGLFNTDEYNAKRTVKFAEFGIKGKQKARDLWRQKDVGTFEDGFEIEVPSHGVAMIRFSSTK